MPKQTVMQNIRQLLEDFKAELVPALREIVREEIKEVSKEADAADDLIVSNSAALRFLEKETGWTVKRQVFCNYVTNGKVPYKKRIPRGKNRSQYIFSKSDLLNWFNAGRPDVSEVYSNNS